MKVGYGPQCQPFLPKSEDGEIAILVLGPVRNRGAGPAAVAARSLLGAGGNQERSTAAVAAALVRKVPALAGSQVPVADALPSLLAACMAREAAWIRPAESLLAARWPPRYWRERSVGAARRPLPGSGAGSKRGAGPRPEMPLPRSGRSRANSLSPYRATRSTRRTLWRRSWATHLRASSADPLSLPILQLPDVASLYQQQRERVSKPPRPAPLRPPPVRRTNAGCAAW